MVKSSERLFKGGDPFVLKYNDVYYAYCTTENGKPVFTPEHPSFETDKDGKDGIEVHISKDLINWENGGYCLSKDDVLGKRCFWAPEVSYYNGKFYMIYAAEEHLAIAVSDDPKGPFKKLTDSWLREKPAIDGHLFFDDDGSIYVYFVSWTKYGNTIYVGKMSDDLKEIEYECEKILIKADKEWETVDALVTEGPFVLKHNGLYYLTYSANHTRCKDYSVGYAVSDSPFGPFEKYKNNPILHKHGDIVGTGHHSFMPTENVNKYICVYHCHGRNIDSFVPREVCWAEAEFVPCNDGADILKVNFE